MIAGGKVLVLGDDTRSFLAIVRSLGRQGIAVHAAPQDFTAPALASRHIAAVHALPAWIDRGASWIEAMRRLLTAEGFDLVIPCNETGLLPLQAARRVLAPLAQLAMPDDRAIATLFDKHATRQLAVDLGIPVAAGRVLAAGESAAALALGFGLPAVVKPRRSYRLERLDGRTAVRICGSERELADAVAVIGDGTHLLECAVPGHGVGVSVLAQRGHVLQAFEHHRVREGASGSYYRVSAPLTAVLLDACARMASALAFTGLAMFEFRVDAPTRRWVLIEVNARPWGSMPLPVALGVDFPADWYRLLVHGEEVPFRSYRTGVYGRNLLPDLEAAMVAFRALGRHPVRQAALLASRGWDFRHLLAGRECGDVFRLGDPAPSLREAGQLVGRLARRAMPHPPGHRRRVRAVARRAMVLGGPIMFVCQGNICRSPFAEAVLRRLLRTGEAASGGMDAAPGIASYGMLPRTGRPTPALGLLAAAGHGFDLTFHRSAHLSDAAARDAGLIVIFDELNRRALCRRHPEMAGKIVRLASFTADPRDIADPFGGDLATYSASYARIAAAVAALASALCQGLAPRSAAAGLAPPAHGVARLAGTPFPWQ